MVPKYYHIHINLTEIDAKILTSELEEMMAKDIGFTVVIMRDDQVVNDEFAESIKTVLGEVFKAAFRIQAGPIH